MPPSQQPLSSADLLALLHGGDEAAAEEVFQRYAQRLTDLARGRLSARLATRVDAEDIVQSAWRSFFVAARAGRFRLESGGDLWRLLVEVTLHKLYRQAARHRAQRRTIQREEPGRDIAQAAAQAPTPDEAAAAADELEAVLEQLPERGRQALALRLQGYEMEEIAGQLGASERTVRRALAEARRIMTARAGGGFLPSAARRGGGSPAAKIAPSAALTAEARLPWSDFVLREQIGAGASGRVYRAWRRSSQRDVTIKFLRKRLAAHPPAVERFLREARTVAQLAHPGIVAVHGAGRTPGGGFFLLMDLVAGRDLEQVSRDADVTWMQAAEWTSAAARIVHFAHERGVVHCDLKPSNLLLDERGQIRVTDFGLAMSRAPGSQPGVLLAGSPAFMAPEQVDSAWGPISPRTDVFGLGAVLYFLLFGRPPHAGADVAETLAQVADDAPVSIVAGDGRPMWLLDVLQKSLAKPAHQRWASAAAMADRLDRQPRM
jgi:RNA polymerase sigma factor (sigma-70 family)